MQRQGKGKGASSSKRMAGLQQQEQSAQAAEERLAAFQAAKGAHQSASKALSSKGGQSARPRVRGQPQGNNLSSSQVGHFSRELCI